MSDLTVTRTVVVTDPVGLHARTAVGIAEIVRRSQSSVTLIKDERRASGTDVLQMLSLYVPRGQSVRLEADGPDAAAVLDALESVFAGQFGDPAQEIASALMQKLQGIAVSPGVAIGEALVMDSEGFRIPRRFVSRDAVVDELERLDKAIAASAAEIAHHRERVSAELGENTAIFEAHLQILQDVAAPQRTG